MTTGLLIALCLGRVTSVPVPDLFTYDERAQIFAYWNKPGRLTSTSIQDGKPGRHRVVFAPEASAYLLRIYRHWSPSGKVKPTELPSPRTSEEAGWDRWIDRAMAHDKWLAQREADAANGKELGRAINEAGSGPGQPGPAPRGMVASFGPPPAFFGTYTPQTHRIRMEDFATSYDEGVGVPRRYPYFRFTEGVNVSGSIPGELELAGLFRRVGLGLTEARVMAAVSRLEGGFDSVNTYDTGYISVGFIQFASLQDGRGSLGILMKEYKRRDRRGFERDFRRYGIDVTSGGMLVVIDPRTAKQMAGADANQIVIRDKRLTAVFERAGKRSSGFRLAQISAAASRFSPGRVPFSVNVAGTVLSGSLGDVIRSEAGLAILMDRYVNTGNLGPVAGVLQDVYTTHKVQTLEQARLVELQVLERLVYRRNFLTSGTLQKPRDQRELLAQAQAAPTVSAVAETQRAAPSTAPAERIGVTSPVPPKFPSQDNPKVNLPRPDERPPASGPVTNVGG